MSNVTQQFENPSFDASRPSDALLTDFIQLLRRHDCEGRFGLHLSHYHSRCEPGMVAIERPGPTSRSAIIEWVSRDQVPDGAIPVQWLATSTGWVVTQNCGSHDITD